jgi:outer membrane receptor for ferrienterochelin and colicins
MQKFSKKSSLALTLCILSAISSSGYAAEKSAMITYSLDEVVVTATKTELTQKENPRSVEVITKEDIQNTGAIREKIASVK